MKFKTVDSNISSITLNDKVAIKPSRLEIDKQDEQVAERSSEALLLVSDGETLKKNTR